MDGESNEGMYERNGEWLQSEQGKKGNLNENGMETNHKWTKVDLGRRQWVKRWDMNWRMRGGLERNWKLIQRLVESVE